MKWDRRDRVAEIEKDYYDTRRKIIDRIIEGKGKEARNLIVGLSEKNPLLFQYLTENLTNTDIENEILKKKMNLEQRFYDKKIRQIIIQSMK